MTLNTALERCAKLVESRLTELLSDGPSTRHPSTLAEPMRYAVLGGGKRVRPFLLLQSAALFDVEESLALQAAAALECIHCYSLVHDDLPAMDDDALRRGRPTVHIAFDEATAILTGDALLTFAFEILSMPEAHSDPAVRSELVLELARASGWCGMAEGQALDLAAERGGFDLAATSRMQALKTGALFRFACEAGAILGKARSEDRQALTAYAGAIGEAFQLADDLLDAEGDSAELGKAAGKDAERGKATLIARLGIEQARARLSALVEEAETALAPFGEKALLLRDFAHFIATRRN